MSVAHNTLLIIRVYFSVKVSKNISSKMDKNKARQIKLIIVPKIPKKLISPRFWKNNDFLRPYPAAKIIGGKIIEKKMSLLNSI